MALTLQQFRDLMRSENPKRFAHQPVCSSCHQPLSESVTGNRTVGDGVMDSDCYFDELSEVVESVPIRTARVRRG